VAGIAIHYDGRNRYFGGLLSTMMKQMSTKVDDTIDSLSQRIGARVRIEREGRGWSLTDLAAHSGVSRAMVHKLERGESSPTATLLARLSGAFGLSMSQLIARAEAKEGRLQRKADQPVWTDPQTRYVRRHVSPPSNDLPLDLVQVELPAGAQVPMPAAVYAAQRQQLIWVLSGALVFMEGDTRHTMEAGDCLELGPPADCVFRNETATSCTYAVVVLRSA
jgi:transcriptional regulator with XRE-family HTH domain